MSSSLASFSARLCASLANSPPREESAFNALALELFSLQFAANEPFQQLCRARGLGPDRITHWRTIPALPTSAFKGLAVTCLPPAARGRVFHSSGTTGQTPSHHFHDDASLAVYEASLRPWFGRHLLGRDQGMGGFQGRMLSLTPPACSVPLSSLAHMLDTVARHDLPGGACFLGTVAADGAWLLNPARVVTELRRAVAEDVPVLFAGTAFSCVQLLDALVTDGLQFTLPAGSRIMETGGYKGRTRTVPRVELHRQLSGRLGVPPDFIVGEYGMSELSSQAYDAVAGVAPEGAAAVRVFHFPPWARAQVVSPETGREVAEGATGLLRVVDLANVFSVLAVQTEDLATRHREGFVLQGRAAQAEARGCSLLPADAAANFDP
jgi:hypothetical protein